MNKSSKIIVVYLLLPIVIVALAVWVYMSIHGPIAFEKEYVVRRDACAEKLKAIRTLEDAYKNTYHCYCGDFDTLFNRLMNEDSLRVVSKVVNYDAIPADVDISEMTELEQQRAGYLKIQEVFVNPVEWLRNEKKLTITDANGYPRQLTDAEILNLRYVPYPKGEKYEFKLQAGKLEEMDVFECKVDLVDLMKDLDQQLVINKLSDLDRMHRYPGWKVGDMEKAVTDGNFE